MLNRKDFSQLEFVFSFVAAFVNTAVGWKHCHPRTRVHIKFLELRHPLSRKHQRHMLAPQSVNTVQHRIQKLSLLQKNTIDIDCETSHYTLRFPLFDHVVENLDRFGSLELLRSSPHGHPNVHSKRSCGKSSKSRTSLLGETLSAVNTNNPNRRRRLHETRIPERTTVSRKHARVSTTGPYLVKIGSRTTAYCIQKASHKKNVPGSAWEMTTDLLSLLGNDTTLAFVSILKEVIWQPYKEYLHDICLEYVRSVYASGDLVPEPKHRCRDNFCFINPQTYPRRPQRNLWTFEFGTEKTPNNVYVLPSTISPVPRRFWTVQVLRTFCPCKPDLARADTFAFVQ